MTESHVFPNYLIHYNFLPQKVNKYPFVLNVTGDYILISLVISLLGGRKPPGSTLTSCKSLHQGVSEGLEHPVGFGSENNLGSICWNLESKLKGSWLNVSSVPYNPSPTICFQTLGNRTPKQRQKVGSFVRPQNGHSLHYSTALPWLTAPNPEALIPQRENKHQHPACCTHSSPWQFALIANLPCCSKFPPPTFGNVFCVFILSSQCLDPTSRYCFLLCTLLKPSALLPAFLIFCFLNPWRTGSMKVKINEWGFFWWRVSQNTMHVPRCLRTNTNEYFLWHLKLLHSTHTFCVFSNFSTSLKEMRELKWG